MKQIILALGFILTCFLGLYAQSNFTLYNMNNIVQGQYENPAFRSKAKVGLSFAPFSNLIQIGASNSGFSIEDVLESNNTNDSLNLTIDKALSQMKAVNYFDVDMRNELFAFHFTNEKSTYGVTINHILHSNFNYPKGLLELVYYGNGGEETIGKRASFDGLGYNMMSYLEFGFVWNRKFGEKLVVGAKVKYLKGVVNVQTANSNFGLYTDAKTFDLTVDGEALVNTSNTAAFYNDSVAIDNRQVRSAIKSSRNNGIAIDLGLTYDLTDKIQLTGSLIDFGQIKWKDNVINYSIEKFAFKYDGIDLEQFLEDSTAIFDKMLDSLEQLADINETANAYKTKTYSRFYVGANYDVSNIFNVGLTWYNSLSYDQYRTAVNLSANLRVKYWLSMTANYGIYNYGKSNLGLGVSVRLATFQIYAMTNSMFALINPQSQRSVDVSVGMSFQIGKVKEDKKKLVQED